MNKFKIKSKKDWLLAFVFAFLIVYALTSRFSFNLNNWLLSIGDYRMTNMSQPESYGNIMLTFAVMTALVFIVLCLKKQRWAARLGVLVVGITLTGASLGAYFLHCSLIIGVAETEEPTSISAHGWANNNYNIVMDEAQEAQLVTYCKNLEPVSAAEQEQLEEEFYAINPTSESLDIWITYPKKYGHTYDLMVCVYEDMIYIRKGYDNNQKEMVTFCQDNGLLSFLKEVNQAVEN